MKRVVLIGDSIRLGYQATVCEELADVAFVWGPRENGQHTTNLLLMFWEWVVAQQPDVLHLNAGLWDMRRVIRGEAGNLVEIDAYRANVSRLLRLAQQHTKAKVIWATSTPVQQERALRTHLRNGLAGRSAADVAIYNQAAMDAARQQGVAVNDLHAVATDAGLDAIQSDDGVHFQEKGYQLLGRAVAKAIRSAL